MYSSPQVVKVAEPAPSSEQPLSASKASSLNELSRPAMPFPTTDWVALASAMAAAGRRPRPALGPGRYRPPASEQSARDRSGPANRRVRRPGEVVAAGRTTRLAAWYFEGV